MSLEDKVEELYGQIKGLSAELKSKADMPADRVQSLEAEITRLDAELTAKQTEIAQRDLLARVSDLEAKAANIRPESKASAILAGATTGTPAHARYDINGSWLKALVDRRRGDNDAAAWVKAVLGVSDATGAAIIPNNVVADLVTLATELNPFRQVMNVVSGVRGAGVDIPYEVTAIQNALLQGAYGSNKDNRDWALGTATATLYTIAQICDLGNQLLRQSEGAAEQVVRRRLGESIAKAEANFIINGTGSSQPLGILQALLAYGDVAAFKYALNSETRASALGNGISKLEALERTPTGIFMHPTNYWAMTTETLGTSGSGGWAMDPVGGATTPRVSVWGVPVFKSTTLPVGTALVGDWASCDIYTGAEFRIDVSSEAGSRFDQNLTGFRAEEEFAFNAEPYVRTGHFVKVTGL